jgi:hypothetical protein
MTIQRCKLSIAFPPDLEDDILECLFDMPDEVAGFSVVSADGHGHGFDRASVRERVRGRVARRLLYLVVEEERVPRVLEGLRAAVRSPAVAYWVEPVSEFGRLAP